MADQPDYSAGFGRVKSVAMRTGLPGIEESTSYGTPALKVRGKLMLRMFDSSVLVVRCPLDEKDMLTQALPDIFFETDHYNGYPAVLVRLGSISDADLEACIERAWRMQAPRALQQALRVPE